MKAIKLFALLLFMSLLSSCHRTKADKPHHPFVDGNEHKWQTHSEPPTESPLYY